MSNHKHEPSIWDADAFFLSSNACPSCGPGPMLDAATGTALFDAMRNWVRDRLVGRKRRGQDADADPVVTAAS